MADEQAPQRDATDTEATEEAWQEVGRQFERLGESLSRAFRAAWESEETQELVRSVQEGLQKMAQKVDRAVQEASESDRGKKLRTEAEKTTETLRSAGEQTWQDARPHLLSLLTKANAELTSLIERLEPEPGSRDQPGPTPSQAGREASTETEKD